MPMKKVCPRCGATFDCMHNDILSCHCATVRLDALQRTYLMENYSDCLCHDCLKAVKDSFYACEINPRYNYNPQIQISAESETKRSIFREKDKTKRSKKESAQHSKSRNKSFVMTSVSAL